MKACIIQKMQNLSLLKNDIKKAADPEKAKVLQRFFKTGKGEYGEGDIFLGITVPAQRKIAIQYKNLRLEDIQKLLQSKIHEERLIALLILVHRFDQGENPEKKEIVDFYLANTKYINNWDLVDLSADKILGEYLFFCHSRENGNLVKNLSGSPIGVGDDTLFKLAVSENLWERRIAMISTYAFIKRGESALGLSIAEKLITDRNDLIQKAVGWMLREVGKRCSREIEEAFLVLHYKDMGRTSLRYAIEHFSEKRRKEYLLGQAV